MWPRVDTILKTQLQDFGKKIIKHRSIPQELAQNAWIFSSFSVTACPIPGARRAATMPLFGSVREQVAPWDTECATRLAPTRSRVTWRQLICHLSQQSLGLCVRQQVENSRTRLPHPHPTGMATSAGVALCVCFLGTQGQPADPDHPTAADHF